MEQLTSRASRRQLGAVCLLAVLLIAAYPGLAQAGRNTSGPDASQVAAILLSNRPGDGVGAAASMHAVHQSTQGLQGTAGALLQGPAPSHPSPSLPLQQRAVGASRPPTAAAQVASILRTSAPPAQPIAKPDPRDAAVRTAFALVGKVGGQAAAAARPTFQLRGHQDSAGAGHFAAAVGARLVHPKAPDSAVAAGATAPAAVLERAVQHVLAGEDHKHPAPSARLLPAGNHEEHSTPAGLARAASNITKAGAPGSSTQLLGQPAKPAPALPPRQPPGLTVSSAPPSQWGRRTEHEARASLFDLEAKMRSKVRELGVSGDPYGLDGAGSVGGGPRTVLGLPKVIWAVVADLIAMLCFLMCIPIVLSCTKNTRRRNPTLSGGM